MQQCTTIPSVKDIKASIKNLSAVCWDMDGTIFNTEPMHEKAFFKMLEGQDLSKLPIKRIKEECTGLTDAQVFERIQEHGVLTDVNLESFINTKNDILIKLIEDESLEECLNIGVINLMEELRINGVKQAVVTSSEKSVTEKLISKFGIQHYFTNIITREDTSENKPAPAPYLYAFKKLEVQSEEVAIFEDSKAGQEAAQKSGANVFAAKWYI